MKKVTFVCPYYSSIRAWQDPTHKRAISEATFLYFDKDWKKPKNLIGGKNVDIFRESV